MSEEQSAVHKRNKRNGKTHQYTCGSAECKKSYIRYWYRDLREEEREQRRKEAKVGEGYEG